MVARAVHFALTEEQASRLTDAPNRDNDFLMEFVSELEEGPNGTGWDDEWTLETDKSWDCIHRCLTDGKLGWGDTPSHKCILGSCNLYDGDEYLINYLDPSEVKQVAEVVKDIDKDELRRRYDSIDTGTYGDLSDSDFEYTWSWFPDLRDFFVKAAAAGRHMLFTVDQ